MKALPILILVAVLCGPCVCQDANNNPVEQGYNGLLKLLDNTGKSIIQNLPLSDIVERYITLGKNVTKFLEQYSSRLSETPRKFIETLVRLARDFIAKIERMLKSTASYYKTSMKGLMTSAHDGARSLLSVFAGTGSNASRKLRSILSSPVEELEQIARSVASEFGNQLLSITLEFLKWTWQFMQSTGIPWMHDTLNRVAAVNGTPAIVRTAIQDMDVAYGLLQLLGFLK